MHPALKHYILNGTKVIEEPDFKKWAKWMGNVNNTIIKQEAIMPGKSISACPFENPSVPINDLIKDSCRISTVFLGMVYGFEKEFPLVFETMAFNGKYGGETNRYSTYDEAIKGHEEIKKRIMVG